jgi:hypothetical protein
MQRKVDWAEGAADDWFLEVLVNSKQKTNRQSKIVRGRKTEKSPEKKLCCRTLSAVSYFAQDVPADQEEHLRSKSSQGHALIWCREEIVRVDNNNA